MTKSGTSCFLVFAAIIAALQPDVVVSSSEIPEFPKNRYMPWRRLDWMTKNDARFLLYVAETWNNFLMSPVERMSYVDAAEFLGLNDAEYISNWHRTNIALQNIAIDSKTWDCWINHYIGNNWAELRDEHNVSWAFEALGWNSSTWKSENPSDWPETENKPFANLTVEETLAAERICMPSQIWDGLKLTEWEYANGISLAQLEFEAKYPPPTNAPTVRPTRYPTPFPTSTPIVNVADSSIRKASSAPSVYVRITDNPTATPSGAPSSAPTGKPSSSPSFRPTVTASVSPTSKPSQTPSFGPSAPPSEQPSGTFYPSEAPSDGPTISSSPSTPPTISPSDKPSTEPTENLSGTPTSIPSSSPSSTPSSKPTAEPSEQPSGSYYPSAAPSDSPSTSSLPSTSPTASPSDGPSSAPSFLPSASSRPSLTPSVSPSVSPSSSPTVKFLCPANFTLDVFTDKYPQETTWTLALDSSGEILAQSFGYKNDFEIHEDTMCIQRDTCYLFEIRDKWDDGMCCQNGQGSYAGYIEYPNSSEKKLPIPGLNGGAFETSQQHKFCVNENGDLVEEEGLGDAIGVRFNGRTGTP